MAKKFKPLIETNKYLKDFLLRELLVERSIITSSRVEGINTDRDLVKLNLDITKRLKELKLIS